MHIRHCWLPTVASYVSHVHGDNAGGPAFPEVTWIVPRGFFVPLDSTLPMKIGPENLL